MSPSAEREISVLVPPGLAPLAPGDPSFVGPYLVIGRIGAGATGTVFAAVDPRTTGEPLTAVKVLHPWSVEDEATRARLRERLAALAGVDGRCYVPPAVFDAEAAQPWLAMGFVSGVRLDTFIAEHGPLGEGRLLALAATLAEGLSALHRRDIAYGDLKPANVVLCATGPRVLDCALPGHGELLRRTAGEWTAPERLAGGPPTTAADVYSWGALVVFAATGRPPVAGAAGGGDGGAAPPVEAARLDLDGVPEELAPIVRRALAGDPGRRPSVRELLGAAIAAWEAVSGDGGPPVQGTAVTQVLSREWRGIPDPGLLPRVIHLDDGRRRRPGRAGLVAVGAAVGLALVAGGAYAAYTALSGPAEPAPAPAPSASPSSGARPESGELVVRFDPAEQPGGAEGPWVYTRVEPAPDAPATPAATVAPEEWSAQWVPAGGDAAGETVITPETEVLCAQFCVPGPGHIEDGRGTYPVTGQDFVSYLEWGRPVIAELELAEPEGEGPPEAVRITELYPAPPA
ncbi:serine/threonine protein kinase [Streptomonospora sp. S1-112]|uniref:Serine/threonine protein kinase n=1 Tax=Streptomonospora mangrovi TaxID=2883123 RepID=A0A9X3P188_9ACTN|nr:serine/threonine-protein kinase [Streptomonospora mangrovi]MDA0567981.1 serine/threonine protein kinase [Streptomonospora mangrovi]